MDFPEQLARLDHAVALDRLGGDVELLRECAQLFLSEYPGLLDSIKEAVSARDSQALQRAAHTMKGAVANFGAKDAYEAAYELESMGRRNDLADVDAACETLVRVMSEIHPALVDLATAA